MAFLNAQEKICFLHIHNTGGTSILKWLEKNIKNNLCRTSSFLPLDKLIRKVISISKLDYYSSSGSLLSIRTRFAHNGGHLLYRDIAPWALNNIPGLRFMAVVRDPCDHITSSYSYLRKMAAFKGWSDKELPSLNEYIVKRCNNDLITDQSNFLVNARGELSKNIKIIRYENLQEEFSDFLLSLSPKFEDIDSKLNKENQRPEKYKNLVSQINVESRSLIRNAFKRDYSLLGYN